MEQVTLNPGAALAAGLIAGLVTLFLTMGLLVAQPRRFPLNPLYLSGALFTTETTAAYLAGLAVLFTAFAGYGIVIAAVFVGFEATDLLPLWGALSGGALSIVTGTSLAYLRVLSRAVRNGLIGDPGPFLLRYGPWSMAELLAAHMFFGLVVGALYEVMT